MKRKVLSLILASFIFLQSGNFVTANSEDTKDVDLCDIDDNMSVLQDIMSDDEILKRGHCERIFKEEESLDSAVFQNIDGTKSLYLFDYPIKFYDEEGKICNKSLELVKSDENIYVPKSSDIEIEFNQNLCDGIKTKTENDDFSLTPLFVSDEKGKSSISEDSKRITYVCDDNVSVEYSLSYQGYKENIILQNYPESNSFDFSFNSETLHLQNEEGILGIVDTNKEIVANIGDILVYDSSGKSSAGELSYRKIDDTNYIITIKADDSFLASSETLYPVYVDPSIEIDYTHMSTCGPDSNPKPGIQHVTVYSDDTLDVNTITVGKKSSSKAARVLMKFPALEESTQFFKMDKSLIVDAKVYLRAVGYQPVNSGMDIYCYQFNSKWATDNVSWQKTNNYAVDYLSLRNVSNANGAIQSPVNTYSFDITSLARVWRIASQSDNFSSGILFKSNSTVESGNMSYTSFGTFTSGAYSPYLIINYKTDCNYDGSENADITYTYRSSPMYLNAGQTYSFRTAKSDNYSACDTELYLFSDNITSNNSDLSWYNDDISTNDRFSRIDAYINTSGYYILMAKRYTSVNFATGNVPTGYCDIYSTNPYTQNETLMCHDAKLGGYIINLDSNRTYNSSETYDSFTANLSSGTADPVMFIISELSYGNRKVIGYNDDYHNNVSPGDHSWGKNSRIKQSYGSEKPNLVFVSAYNSTSVGTGDIYAMCRNNYSNPVYFPAYKSDDIIVSANNSNAYNCIAYSGGISSNWITPYVDYAGGRLTPWHGNTTEASLDNFYGNNPPRYNGATTYVVTNNSDEAIVNVYRCGTEWTHASVRKPGNNQMHGYAWESKLGANARVFHEYSSLNNDFPSKYGHPVRYYSIDSTISHAVNSLSFEESILSGKTYIMDVYPDDDEMQFLRGNIEGIDNELKEEFNLLYSSWIKKIKKDDALSAQSNAYKYTLTDEYKKIADLINKNTELMYYIIDEYLCRDNSIFMETLFDYMIVERNEYTQELADSIRITNNQKCLSTLNNDKYMAPTTESNFRTFAVSVLNDNSFSKVIGKEKVK